MSEMTNKMQHKIPTEISFSQATNHLGAFFFQVQNSSRAFDTTTKKISPTTAFFLTDLYNMGKQVRKTFKPRANPMGLTVNGSSEIIANQQLTIQPDQVLPVVDKVQTKK